VDAALHINFLEKFLRFSKNIFHKKVQYNTLKVQALDNLARILLSPLK
jgi:hypothetical protein